MADTSKVDNDDNLEDSSSSEEWTIIYKKESNLKQNRLNSIEHIEVHEKEIESDDVSILSDESESEQLINDGKVEIMEWQIESKQSTQLATLSPNHTSDRSITSSALITCSVIALISGIIIAGQIIEFQGHEPNYFLNNEIQAKLKEFIGIKEKLNDLNDVKRALHQIQGNIQQMKKLKDQLINKKYKKNKSKYSGDNYKNFEKLNIENIFNLDGYDNKLEMLEITFQNFCSIITKINSTSNLTFENKLCKTPKILSDMIILKKNFKQILESNVETDLPENRVFLNVERKLELVSESLLFDFNAIFSKFTKKIQERLNKVGSEIHNRLCFSYNKDKINDKFFNILNKNYFLSNCNESNSDPAINLNSNVTKKNKKGYGTKKKSYLELKKNAYKNNYKNIKDYKNFFDSKKNNSYTKIYPEENFIKGEATTDNNWKKNKKEKKEKYSLEEKKYKYEKTDKYKNDCNKKYEKTNQEFDYNFEFNKNNHKFNYEADHKKDDSQKKSKHQKSYDFNEGDSKFIVNVENYSDKYLRNKEEKERYKNDKEYILKPENLKESKYVKYQEDEHWEKRDKYRANSDWQIQRGKAREKQRNSDWYFVRADSREKARIVEEDDKHT
ncbi:PREDICTED: MATH and LRR domain-containing protein PFE0570w-like [Ceratosolen solmsi marchali]|uniref:MATH and LRR domain-containing protein PFE0570w-like n=1 Tax=Ceratosolen solmsi marchali TaxID=326594 RepID=A0AAJ6VMD2_9HYME|nr:PREDICTED: MATH and LRR domain-containing protein PFE0570w-like [Ceratosolen solmsi marchali]